MQETGLVPKLGDPSVEKYLIKSRALRGSLIELTK
jgi:hypothetical protein